jgi:TonB family protein
MRNFNQVFVFTVALVVVSVSSARAQASQEKAAVINSQPAVPGNTVAASTPTTVIAEEVTLNGESAQVVYSPAKVDMVLLKKNLEYPAKAIAAGVQGNVTLVVYLNAQGEPVNVNFETTTQPNSNVANELAQAAFKAVKNCKFTPATRNNTPVSSAVKVPVKFML